MSDNPRDDLVDWVMNNPFDAADKITHLQAALNRIHAMFLVSHTGAVLLKGDYGNYSVLETANAALKE